MPKGRKKSRGPVLPGLMARWKKYENVTLTPTPTQYPEPSKVARLDLAEADRRTQLVSREIKSPRNHWEEKLSTSPPSYEYPPSFHTNFSRRYHHQRLRSPHENFSGKNSSNEWLSVREETRSPNQIPLDETKFRQTRQSPDVAAFLKRISPSFTDEFINSGLKAHLLPKTTLDFELIQTYVRNGQSYDSFGIRLLNVLEVSTKNKTWALDPNIGSLKQMLFHGTQSENIPAILEYGLQCPHSWNQSQRFGQGIYFTDRISKCVHFSYENPKPRIGQIHYVLLCEVQLGRVCTVEASERHQHQYRTTPPAFHDISGTVMKYDSVMIRGRQVPDPRLCTTSEEVYWPIGPTVCNPDQGSRHMVRVNEFVVYLPEQIKVRFIVEVEITNARC